MSGVFLYLVVCVLNVRLLMVRVVNEIVFVLFGICVLNGMYLDGYVGDFVNEVVGQVFYVFYDFDFFEVFYYFFL